MTEKNEINSLINQAKSEARSESLRNFLSKNSKKIIVAGVAVVVIALLFIAFSIYNKSQQEKYSTMMHQSLIDQQIGDVAKAKAGLKEIYESKMAPKGVKSFAAIRYAAFILEEGKVSEAIKIYQTVNECSSCDDYVRDLAGLLIVKLWIADSEEVKKEDLTSRIEKIENRSSVLKYYIAEQRAFLELQRNNLEKAYKIFDVIAQSPEGSQLVKERAANGLKMVISRGYEPKAS